MSAILFLVILSVLVFIHELGHFIAAKRFGVRVDEFAVGFPPRIFKKKIGETTYALNLIPFGGYVKIFGENPDEESISGNDSGRSFVHISKWKQIVVLSSGVLFNILFAWLLFSVAYMSGMTASVSQNNSSYVVDKHVIILDVLASSPAASAGFVSGDYLIAVKTGDDATTTISYVEDVQKVVQESDGKNLGFEIIRNGKTEYLALTPKQNASSSVYVMGVAMDLAGKVKLPPHLALWEGGKLTVNMFKGIAVGLYSLIHDSFVGTADFSQISGPVGIARLVGDASSLGFIYLLSFTAFISINLAVLNLVPFPALDGGRILFVIIEAIQRKPIKPLIANTVNAIGFGLLILLMLFVTYRDIVKLF